MGDKDERSLFQRLLVHVEPMPQYVITRARSQDLEHLPHIERAAACLLSGHAPESVLNETTSQDELQEAVREGHLWVALADDVPVGFAHIVRSGTFTTDC